MLVSDPKWECCGVRGGLELSREVYGELMTWWDATLRLGLADNQASDEWSRVTACAWSGAE